MRETIHDLKAQSHSLVRDHLRKMIRIAKCTVPRLCRLFLLATSLHLGCLCMKCEVS